MDAGTARRRQRARRGGALLAAASAVLLLGAVAASSPAPAAGAAAIDRDNGPVGWDVYRRLDQLAGLPRSASSHQFSSFDRTGDNNDGFDGSYSCLRESTDGCVIAEAVGPGEVTSIWFTADIFDPGHLGSLGNLVIELDGRRVVDAPLQDVVDGKLGPPFVYPLVANRQQSSGGSYLKLPMPYRESMRISTEHRANFYHVGYRRFADATGVDTFDPGRDKATDVIAMLREAGRRDPKPARPGARTSAWSGALEPGETSRPVTLAGPGTISELAVRLPQVVGPRVQPQLVDDGRAVKGSSDFTLRIDPANTGVRLTRRVDTYWPNSQDGTVSVDGVVVGAWPKLPVMLTPRWADVHLDLPAELTAGKSRITVHSELPPVLNGFQEFTYWADSTVGGRRVRTDTLDVGPEHTAGEAAHDYRVTGQVWAGSTRAQYPPAGDAEAVDASDRVLEGLRLRISFDGVTTVDAPVGEFFGSGLGDYPVTSLMFSMDAEGNGWYRSWWPMPYGQRAVVELVNGSGRRVAPVEVSLRSARGPAPDQDTGYFHATSRAGDPAAGQDWLFLDTPGRGRLVGVSHTMRGHRMDSLTQRGYLEGDERVYVDGARSPRLYGTGTEDFYEGAWYFAFGTFSNPQNGNTAFEAEEFGCTLLCDSTYRLMIGDAVEFGSSLRFGMEHGHGNEWKATYSSTAFWYGRDDPRLRVTDELDVGDPDSERAHRFSGAAAAAVSLTSVFEGDDDGVQVTDSGRSATGGTSFRLAVDPGNRGVVLRRTSDQRNGYQATRVLVGGKDAGLWLQPLANPTQRWLDDEFALPARLTAGRRYVDVTLAPAPDAPPWHAARYQALSLAGEGG